MLKGIGVVFAMDLLYKILDNIIFHETGTASGNIHLDIIKLTFKFDLFRIYFWLVSSGLGSYDVQPTRGFLALVFFGNTRRGLHFSAQSII